MSAMPVNVETLPEQGMGRWVVREGFSEDAVLGKRPTEDGREA